MSNEVKEIKQVVRAVKYKQNECDFNEEVDLKSLVNELKPRHDEKLEIIIRRVQG